MNVPGATWLLAQVRRGAVRLPNAPSVRVHSPIRRVEQIQTYIRVLYGGDRQSTMQSLTKCCNGKTIFLKYVAIGRGKLSIRCISSSVPPTDKMLYTCFRGKLFNGPHAKLHWRWRRCIGNSFILARVVVSVRHLSRLLCFTGRKNWIPL